MTNNDRNLNIRCDSATLKMLSDLQSIHVKCHVSKSSIVRDLIFSEWLETVYLRKEVEKCAKYK